jgi:hypothetical protein
MIPNNKIYDSSLLILCDSPFTVPVSTRYDISITFFCVANKALAREKLWKKATQRTTTRKCEALQTGFAWGKLDDLHLQT